MCVRVCVCVCVGVCVFVCVCACVCVCVLSRIHISEPTRLRSTSTALFCLKTKKKNIYHILLATTHRKRQDHITALYVKNAHASHDVYTDAL